MDNLIHKLDKLRGTSDLSSFDKQEIESLYKQVLAKTFVKTNCSDCYRDACIEMILQLKRYGKMKEKCNYSLKNGVLLQVAFGSGEFITNANITDENAEAYLRNILGNPQPSLAHNDRMTLSLLYSSLPSDCLHLCHRPQSDMWEHWQCP